MYENLQRLLLNEYGQILTSSDRIFPAASYGNRPVFDEFPLLESLFESLLSLPCRCEPLLIQAVNYAFVPGRPGYYDYSFCRLEKASRNFILWQIYDQTRFYEKRWKQQQARNNAQLNLQ